MPRAKKNAAPPIAADQLQAIQIAGIRHVTENRVKEIERSLPDDDLAKRFLFWIQAHDENLFDQFATQEVLG